MDLSSTQFFCSWSGGKDSCLALYHAIQQGGVPKALLTMLREDGKRSRSHGLSTGLIQRQAESLGVPLIVRSSSWNDYEQIFLSSIRQFRKEGIKVGVFGDIDLEEHWEWVRKVCSSARIKAYEPLWKRPRRDLLREFLDLGFNATIVSVKQGVLDTHFLGLNLSEKVIQEMEDLGVDASGEGGEYHTVVTDGPIFSSSLHVSFEKKVVVRDGYCFLVGVDGY